MADGRTERRLTAILAADVVGYARMLRTDETATLAGFRASLDLLAPLVGSHHGRIVKTMGDGVLATFASAVEALGCAVDFQRAMSARNAALEPGARMLFRVGVNAGDAVIEGGDVFGDAVTLAARLEAMAPPGGVCVSARVHEDARGRSDLVFEDLGERQLKNIDAPVRLFGIQLDAGADARAPMTLPDRPSIAVLPLENISGDPAHEYVADAITEDVISALSRWRWFFVIARNSTFTYKGRAVDVQRVGRELGVRYVLEGSVRRSGTRVRVVTQLIDAASGAHIWSDTFDRDLADLFALYDEITEHVVGAIEPAMLHHESVRAAHKSAGDLTAFDCFQRGMWHLNQVSKASFREAETLFRDAIGRDPAFPLGHVGLARVLYGRVAYGWAEDAEADLAGAEAAANAAIRLDARDAWAHFALSGALLYLGRHDEALREAERTLVLNPNFAFGHFRLGQVLIYLGRASEAAGPLERSIRLNPFDPQMGAMIGTLALAHFHSGAYELAVSRAIEASRQHEKRAPLVLAASLARLGRSEEGRAVLTDEVRTRAIKMLGRRRIPYANEADLQDLLEALRLAGFDRLPELLALAAERANSSMSSSSG
ncbi:MAG: adenylate/guanylate cyclase domain-containing protein [Hyphomonadaceae bacterium]